MIRKNQQARRELRQAEREKESLLADQQVYGEYDPPNREDCIERLRPVLYSDDGMHAVEIRTWTQDQGIADFHFSIYSQGLQAGEWARVKRFEIDICHGHAHFHKIETDGQKTEAKTIMRIDTIADVQRAYSKSTEHAVRLIANTESEMSTR